MKKLIYLLVLALILGLVLTGCLLSNVGQVPSTEQKGMPSSTANLVALWHFDEDSGAIAYDSTANGNDGTISGTSWVDGKLGKALRFDGSADYVDCGDDASFNFVDDKFTVEAWINGDVFQAGYYDLIVFRGYNNWAFGVFKANRLMFGETGWTGSFSRQIYSDPLLWTPGQWYHIAVVYDTAGKTADFYRDGDPVGVVKQSTDKLGINNSGIVTISYSNTTGFDGIIDEVRIWDGALTAGDILYSYADETLHVDDDWAQWPGAYYTITEALAVAGDGDTIIVHEGTYNENIIINKTLAIEGVPGSIINGDTNVDGTPDGNCITINADGVTIDGFEITNGYNGIIGQTSNSVIKNNTIHDNLNYIGSNGVGILLWGQNDDNTIENNKIYNNDRQGIFIGFWNDTKLSLGNTISGNEIYNNGLYRNPNGPDESAYGVQLWNADDNTIENNDIYNHDNWWFAQGIYLCASYNNVVSGNNLHLNNYGVGAWSAGRTPIESNKINCNNIDGNTGYGVITYDSVVIDATHNWWGHASGPSGSGPGTGDAVSDYVNYDYWAYIPDFCDCEAKTIGYWKNHLEYVHGIVEVLGGIEVGTGKSLGVEMSAEDIFTKPHSKTYSMLAAQLLAAKLNVAQLSQFISGYDSSCVSAEIGVADGILSVGENNYIDDIDKDDKEYVNGIKDVLDEFNINGCPSNVCPCICY